MDVIHSFCASLNGLDTSIDRYKYNHSPPTIKCTVLCFRLMIFLSIEKNGWAAFLIFRCFLLPFFIHFPLLYLPLPPLSLPLSLYQLQSFFAIFMRQLFIYVSAQLDFISFLIFSLCSSLETYRADPHAMQHGSHTVTHKLLQVWVALLSLCQN